MQVYLVRHGKCAGNYQRRYIGRTDQPLAVDGARVVRQFAEAGYYPPVEIVYSSPLLRCQQTAALAYRDVPCRIVPELRECDFGRFEGKTYQQMEDDVDYRTWVENGCRGPIPEGEDHESFAARCRLGFERVMAECWEEQRRRVALVIHGGSIMAILEVFWGQPGSFHHWHTNNGEGWVLHMDEALWRQRQRIAAATVLPAIKKEKKE